MSDEWGPWIEHDGKGCPCVGQYVRVDLRNGVTREVIAGEECRRAGVSVNGERSSWVWMARTAYQRGYEVIRYRIRRPRGLTILQDLIENPPAPVREMEDA